jgi:hypothetical protein
VNVPAKWKFATTATEAQRVEIVSGHNIWDYEWQPVKRDSPAPRTGNDFKDMLARYETAQVIDPQYGKTHEFQIYEITVDGRVIRFAAGEFSNGIFGFYLPDEGEA